MLQLEFNARMLKSLLSPLFYISQWHCKSKLPSLILCPFTPLSTVETCINSNQKEQASSNPCRSSGLFLEMFWLRNTRWSHCLSEASLRLSCMLLAGRLSHRTTERRSRCVEAFLCRLRTIHESLRNYIKYYLYQLQDNVKKIKMFHVKHWVQRDVEIIYLLIIHAVEYICWTLRRIR